MIKILKEGKIPKPTKVIYKTTCKHCGCEFEFEVDDCKKIERTPGGDMTVECPYCHIDITQARFRFVNRIECDECEDSIFKDKSE